MLMPLDVCNIVQEYLGFPSDRLASAALRLMRKMSVISRGRMSYLATEEYIQMRALSERLETLAMRRFRAELRAAFGARNRIRWHEY